MDNYALADQLALLSKLMEIHGENSFKAKAYASAAFALEKWPEAVAAMPREKIGAIKGIGESAGKKVVELLETGELDALNRLLEQTPEGVLELMNVKGLGSKKIFTLWKELHIDSIDALRHACETNTLAAQKGFGEKTQQNILEVIRYQQENKHTFLYAQADDFAAALQTKLQEKFSGYQLEITGAFRRQLEVVDALEWVTTIPYGDLKKFFEDSAYQLQADTNDKLQFQANGLIGLTFYLATEADFGTQLFITTGSQDFVTACQALPGWINAKQCKTEHGVFKNLGLPDIPPALRETPESIKRIQENGVPELIILSDIKGLIHAHSNWSDGAHPITEIAEACKQNGFEYLVLSDHSKAAFYANGLNEARVQQQQQEIDELNKSNPPFKIFKSIECDILADGDMDFAPEVLASFDVVIASIHSNLQMTEEKAMRRLLGAITNPFVSILGHMTGRLLTRRKGYPVDHKTIIDACAQHNVVIEINASPSRLDMDWRWIAYALEKNVLLSIDPDAHTIDDFRWLKYGVLVAQKGGLINSQNLSSMPLWAFEKFVQQQKQKRVRQ